MINFNQQTGCSKCYLRSPLFDSLTQTELNSVQECRLYKNIEKGQKIAVQGEPASYFIYLLSGLIKVYVTDKEGSDHIVSIAKPLDFVGLFGIFHHQVYPFSMSTIENCTLCMLPRETIVGFARQNSNFSLMLLEKISSIAEEIIAQRIAINQKHLRGRLAMVLLDFASFYKSDEFELPVSRREIGELIDMTTENIIRIMSEFRKDGIISINGKKITIVNKPLLQKINDKG